MRQYNSYDTYCSQHIKSQVNMATETTKVLHVPANHGIAKASLYIGQ